MKTILIATDFSAASLNASIYGLQLAKAVGANIILFNAYKIPSPASGIGVKVSRYDVMMQTNKHLLEEAKKLDPKGAILDIICDEGSANQAIINIANEKKADLIITGMKGSGRSFKKLLGSTATALAKNTTVPLMIVPEDAKFTNPGIIVFASDAFLSDSQLPQELISFARMFNSKLYVVKVIKNKNEEWFEVAKNNQMPKRIIEILDTSFQYPVDTDIRHALNDFIEKHKADLLVMTPHKHEWVERLFAKSQTTDMIFHTKIPLLVLPEAKTKFKNQKNKNLEIAIL
jgi:nucleotide-binding universal stress UspA family protein